MGMYTELVLKCDVKPDLPEQVSNILHFLFTGRGEVSSAECPDHPFFRCHRWSQIGSMSSYYHIPWSTSDFREGRIFSRSDLKDYDGEIDLFLDWLRPYLDHEKGCVIGWTWYEESAEPTLIYA